MSQGLSLYLLFVEVESGSVFIVQLTLDWHSELLAQCIVVQAGDTLPVSALAALVGGDGYQIIYYMHLHTPGS